MCIDVFTTIIVWTVTPATSPNLAFDSGAVQRCAFHRAGQRGRLDVKNMTPAELHDHFNSALSVFSTPAEENGFRALIEATGVETFLTGLLFMRLHAAGHHVSRDFPVGNRCAADLTLHRPETVHIELKQLHLKDGCRYAPQNLTNDLRRHGSTTSLGILYVADERFSTTLPQFQRHGGANRRAKRDLASVHAEFPRFFRTVYPATAEQGLLREFKDHGGLRLYAFVVSDPLAAGDMTRTLEHGKSVISGPYAGAS